LPSLHRLADNTSVSCCSSGAISVCIFLFLSLLCFLFGLASRRRTLFGGK
jgi:hypothetical protein